MTTKNLHTIESNEAFETRTRKAIATDHRFDPTDQSAIWIWNRLPTIYNTECVGYAPDSNLGYRYFYIIKWNCRRFEHHVDYRERTYPGIWYP